MYVCNLFKYNSYKYSCFLFMLNGHVIISDGFAIDHTALSNMSLCFVLPFC